VDGIILLVEVKDLLKNAQDSRAIGRHRSVAALSSQNWAKIPIAGDAGEIAGSRFEVVDMDGVRVDKG
jgi:CBS domain containing-hemolysin-like protein